MTQLRRASTALNQDPAVIKKRNFRNVQIDAVGIGLANAAAPFLPVFLTRLNATNFQVGLLSAMPAFTGLILAFVVGSFLQRKRNIVPWFSAARLMVVSSYALTGIVPFLVPRAYQVPAVLAIWALATLPQIVVNVAFSVVMNAVAGPEGRYDLMSRRWSILGLTSAITVAAVGQILDGIKFPINYQIVFMALSVGGLISYYFSSNIKLRPVEPMPILKGETLGQRFKGYASLVGKEKPFLAFTGMRFVYLTGTALAAPLFPLYYVRILDANDSWIGIINFAQTFVLLLGYYFWTRQSRKKGGRYVLLRATLGMSIYPAITALTHNVQLIAVYAGIAGILQAGVDLVFFDELMKTVPEKYSPTFVSLAQSLQYASSMVAPLVGSLLADTIGIPGGLIISAGLRLAGFALFLMYRPPQPAASSLDVSHEDLQDAAVDEAPAQEPAA